MTPSDQPNPWTTVASRVVYENPWFRVREDQVIRPDGRPGIYGVMELPPSVGVVALDRDGRVALVEQWRYPHHKVSLEIPSGSTDPSDSDLAAAARRELAEESGLSAGHLAYMGSMDNSNGATTDIAHMFLATDLTHGAKPTLGDERTELVWQPLDVAVSMALDGHITESVSVAALLKVALTHLAPDELPRPVWN